MNQSKFTRKLKPNISSINALQNISTKTNLKVKTWTLSVIHHNAISSIENSSITNWCFNLYSLNSLIVFTFEKINGTFLCMFNN